MSINKVAESYFFMYENFEFSKTFATPWPKDIFLKRDIDQLFSIFQFYSYIVLVACSDKSLRVMDMNAQQILRQIPHCHAKPVTKLVLVR